MAVIIYHAAGLHMGVADGRAKEFHTSFFEVFADGIRYVRGDRVFFHFGNFIFDGLMVYIGPHIVTKAAKFLLDRQKHLGIAMAASIFPR